MLKLIKKYNKWLLAVFGVMLMLTFLVQGTAGSMRGDPGKQAVATMAGSKLTANDLRDAEVGFKFVEETVPALVRGMGIENHHHWFLLTTEATRAGLVGDVQDGLSYRPKLAEEEAYLRGMARYGQFLRSNPGLRQFIEQQLQKEGAELRPAIERSFEREVGRARMTEEEANLVLAKFRGVGRLLRAANSAHRMSDRAAVAGFRRLADGAIVDAVVITARPLASTAPAPTEAELAAHFDRFRAIDPASRPDGIGYVLPQRVELEWLKIDKAAVREAIKPDPVQINKVYMQDQLLEATKRKYPADLATERGKIEQAIVDDTLAKVLGDVDQIARGTLSFAVDKLPKDGAYRKVTPDWVRPSAASLAQTIVDGIKTRQNITIPLPVAERREQLLGPTEVGQLPGIGQSTIRIGDSRRPFPQAAFNLKEFSPPSSIGLQVGVPFIGVPATDAADNRYYFTITRAVDSGPAPTLDDVRARAEEDWRTVKAFEKLLAEMETERLLAVSDGLESLSKKFKTIAPAAQPDAFDLRKQVSLARVTVNDSDPLQAQAVVDAVLELASGIDPLTQVSQVSPVLRTIAVAVPERHTVVIVQIQALRPVTQDDLHLISDNDVRSLADRELQTAAGELSRPYALDTLKKRLNYKLISEDAPKKNAPPATAPETAPPAKG